MYTAVLRLSWDDGLQRPDKRRMELKVCFKGYLLLFTCIFFFRSRSEDPLAELSSLYSLFSNLPCLRSFIQNSSQTVYLQPGTFCLVSCLLVSPLQWKAASFIYALTEEPLQVFSCFKTQPHLCHKHRFLVFTIFWPTLRFCGE